jgi:ribosome-binding factor A
MTFDRNERALSVLTGLVADFVRQEANTNPLITVTRIDTSPDMKRAVVMITAYPTEREEAAVIFMKRKGTELRDHIKKNSRLRHIPHFEFMLDYGERNRQHVDEVAKRIEGEVS